MANACRICGWEGMAFYHKGAVDCINAYRAYVEDLRSQLPRGKQVMVSTIERDVSAQVWIDGNITFKGLDRLIILIRFMQEAWTEESDVKPTVLHGEPSPAVESADPKERELVG